MTFIITNAWQKALQVRGFRYKIGITLVLLILCAFLAPVLFQFIQQRPGILLDDYLLARLPTVDLSLWIFLLLYAFIFWGILSLAKEPDRFLLALQAYVLLTVLRFITLLLTPLEPPAAMAILIDPFVQRLFYQETITKDLFFSGHTSLLVLFTLTLPHGITRKIFFAASIAIAAMLLLQHAHYTVDVVLAPVFAWIAIKGVRLILKRG